MKHRYVVIFDREVDGRFIAEVPGIPGCLAYGRSRRQAFDRVKRTLRFFLEEARESGIPIPRQTDSAVAEIEIVA